MEEFFRRTTVTGRSYDIFKTVKILNLQQAMFYVENDVFPVDIKVGVDTKIDKVTGEPTKKKVFIFYFDREESRAVYDAWCNNK